MYIARERKMMEAERSKEAEKIRCARQQVERLSSNGCASTTFMGKSQKQGTLSLNANEICRKQDEYCRSQSEERCQPVRQLMVNVKSKSSGNNSENSEVKIPNRNAQFRRYSMHRNDKSNIEYGK
ncbi:hypothetical protein AB6A40_008012 [Gnathostoma spinigerum]|uniref:Uncharacterized protein n=1 Tax=Gnathostoma spinigerum TaxID=75299 RepID=A0ABD6EN59_9BILA